jgi:hypothetical protein
LAKRTTTWTGLAHTVDGGVIFGASFAERRCVSFQALVVSGTGGVQVDAAVRTAAMISFRDDGLLIARGELDDVGSWSPISWKGVNLRKFHAVSFRAVGAGWATLAFFVLVLIKVCSFAQASSYVLVSFLGSSRSFWRTLLTVRFRRFTGF